MTADRLRQAATLLRNLAEAATGSRWGVVGSAGLALNPNPFSSAIHAGTNAPEDAAYIATMSPPVALALADWLDAVVLRDPKVLSVEAEPALAVADAILGDRA